MKKYAIVFGIAIAAIVSVIGINNAVADYKQMQVEASANREEVTEYWLEQAEYDVELINDLADSEYYKELGYNSQSNVW